MTLGPFCFIFSFSIPFLKNFVKVLYFLLPNVLSYSPMNRFVRSLTVKAVETQDKNTLSIRKLIIR